MSLSIVVTPGYNFPAGVPVTLAALRRGAQPTVQISGAVGSGDLAPGAITNAAVTPDAFWYGLDTGNANALAVTLDPAPTAYEDGLVVSLKVANANTGATTLAVNGLAAATLLKNGNLALEPGDLIQGQIIEARYQLDVNVVAAGAAYSGGGTISIPVVAGRSYVYTIGANDATCLNNGVLVTSGSTFVAGANTVTLSGTVLATVTSTIVPVSNVWQLLSQTANPNKYFNFQPATTYKRGIRGLVPGPKAGEQGYYLRADGTWGDVVTELTDLATTIISPIQTVLSHNFLN